MRFSPEFLWLLLALPFAGCTTDGEKRSPPTPAETPRRVPATEKAFNVSGQAYFFAPELDSATCEVSGACDCCSSTILFLDERRFVFIDYCVTDETVSRGTYTTTADQVRLRFDSLRVEQVFDHIQATDTPGLAEPASRLTRKVSGGGTSVLRVVACHGAPRLKTVAADTAAEVMYGAVDTRQSLAGHVRELDSAGIWRLIAPRPPSP